MPNIKTGLINDIYFHPMIDLPKGAMSPTHTRPPIREVVSSILGEVSPVNSKMTQITTFNCQYHAWRLCCL